MDANLLLTKLFTPRLRVGNVPRPALVERLQAGWQRGCRLTLISAPAGYGKTSLVAEWLAEHAAHGAWVSLSEEENEPARFFMYVLAGLRQVDPALGAAFGRRLMSPRLPAPTVLMGALVNDLAAYSLGDRAPVEELADDHADRRLLLVLDDLHVIQAPEIYEALDFLVEHAPPTLRLILVTRQDPPLALSRLRARGQLLEIRQEALRFSETETAALLSEALGEQALPKEIAAIQARTEGWVAGLQLAALSMRGQDAVARARFVAGFSGRHQFILDYLTDEVLRRQPVALQSFLLRTAILEQLCGPLCDAVLERDGASAPDLPFASQDVLEHLERANLFVVPLDYERRWYRYHHLFAELLRARLNEQEPGLARGLHRRAAEWHERNGTVASAVHHALRSGDPDLAADTVERAIRSLATWSSVEVNTVLGWLHALPATVRRRRAWLMLFEARAQYITGQMDAARRTLKMLDAWLETHPEGPETAQLRAIMRADYASYAVVRGDAAEAIEYAGKALADTATEDRSRQVRPAAILGLAYLRLGNVRAAVETLNDALDAALSTGQAFVAIPLYCNLAEARLLQGRLRQAQQACDKARDLAESAERPLAVAGFVRLQLGKIAYERNELASAEAYVREALTLLGQGGITENFGSFYGVLALVLQALGKVEEASVTARRAVLLAQEEGVERLVNLAQAYEARVWLAQGALESAERWARLYRGLPPSTYLREFEDLTLVRLQLALGESEQALTRLDALLAPALADGRQGRILEGNVLRAVALQQLGDTAGALETLSIALELAEPEGYRRVFLEAGPIMVTLLSHAGEIGSHRAFVAALQASGRQAQAPQTGAVTPSGQTRLVEPLTERELEVLTLLARGLSNPEIAKQLVLSVHTVRSHAYNLYGKLDVHSRTQAVARARELALLPDD